MKKRLWAVMLALALLAGMLAGCSKNAQTQTQAELPSDEGQSSREASADQSGQQTATVTAKYAYKADYRQITAPLSYVYSMCAVESGVYISAAVDGAGASYDGVFRVDAETGECTELSDLALPTLPDGWEGGAHVEQIQAADDGSLWLLCNVFTYRYALPEDFDPETDVQWNYYEEGESYTKLLHVTADGARLAELTLQPANGEAIGISSFCLDAAGNLYANDWQNVYVYDEGGNFLFDVSLESGRSLCRAGDQVGVSQTIFHEDGSGVSFCFRAIDVASQGLGEEKPLPYGIGAILPGDERYDLYYTANGRIYGYCFDGQTSEKLVDWLEVDVNANDLYAYCFLPDGRVAAVLRAGSGAELVVLTRVDASTLPQKTAITLACLYLPYDLRESIVAFNRTNEQYRIVVNDYSEYVTDGSYDAAITKLNTEILSGKIPDLFVNNDVMPIDLYAAKGVIADLYELIDEDQTLSREAFVQPVLKAMETDGKLYELPTTFYLETAFGLSKYVGEYETWTMADLQDAMAKLPDGASVMEPYNTKLDMLRSCLASDMGAFVDWQTGTASFDGDKFIELLAFCNTCPEEFDSESFDWAQYGSTQQALGSGQQLLGYVTLGGFVDYAGQCLGYDGGVTFVGFPSSDGSGRSTFCKGDSFSICAASENRDAAWAFVRERLLEQLEESSSGLWGFPILQAAFDAAATEAMTTQYRTDENGQTLYDENGEPSKQPKTSYSTPDGQWVRVYELSQEQVDAVTALINSTTCVYRYDKAVMDIVQDEADAFFAGGRSAGDTAKMVQNRVSLYMAEQG